MLFIAKVNSLLEMWSPGRVPIGNWDWAEEEFTARMSPCPHTSSPHIASILTCGFKCSVPRSLICLTMVTFLADTGPSFCAEVGGDEVRILEVS